MLFIVEQIDLNASTFNENTGYHVIPKYGPLGGHLRKLSSEIYGKMFHGFEMDRSKLEDDLEEALKFQRTFAEAVCTGLDARFVDNNLITCYKILNPTNMPSKQIGLQNWGVIELEKLLTHYGYDRSQEGLKYPPFVHVMFCKRELLAFKLQATTN